MMKPRIIFADSHGQTDAPSAGTVRLHVNFDADAVAAAIGVQGDELINRMLQSCARAVCFDAGAMAEADMRARGLVFPVDGVPAGWPTDYLVATVLQRLYPEKKQ